MSGTVKVGSVNLTITDNKSSDIALASFSGYLATIAELSGKYGGQPGKTIAIVLEVVNGVITGLFDKNLNPQKEYADVIGTYLSGYALGTVAGLFIDGAVSGFIAGSAGGPVGAVVGAIAGAVLGGLYCDDLYDNGEKLIKALADNLDDSFEYFDSTIYGKVTKDEFIAQSAENDPDFCKRVFPQYLNYRQVTTIKNSGETLADFIKYNNKTKEAEIKSNTLQKEKEYVELITKTTQAKQIQINNVTFNITQTDNLTVRNAIDDIPKVSILLTHILIKTGEKLDLGDKGIYTVKSGDTLSEIANNIDFKDRKVV